MKSSTKNEKTITETSNQQANVSMTKNPLVFISHDTRDAELAEEFSNLLKTTSAGFLKSFRTSDKKGTQGLDYGQEWYPAIMNKIDEASDVVCLLTKNSIDRPWILYEAGVAKGKLDKKVIGIALGIQLSIANNGPFAQFQNNDGDSDSITKLVMELVKKIPGTDPDQSAVKMQVDSFLKIISPILEKLNNQNKKEEKNESVDENSVAKLFEEVKIMFDALPSRIENRIDPDAKMRRRRFHPMMFEELMHMGLELKETYIGFLMMISMFKDDFPWFYEIGLETYRGLKNTKNSLDKKKYISTFERAFEMLNHPMMREMFGKSDDMYFLFKEGRHIIMKYLEKLIKEDIILK